MIWFGFIAVLYLSLEVTLFQLKLGLISTLIIIFATAQLNPSQPDSTQVGATMFGLSPTRVPRKLIFGIQPYFNPTKIHKKIEDNQNGRQPK